MFYLQQPLFRKNYMMSFALASISSLLTGGLAAAPVTALGLIPLIVIGMNFYRYQSVDPEARPIEATKVNSFKQPNE